MHEPFDITTVVFALLAVFVVWKLRSVLGTRTGEERPPSDPFAARRKSRESNPNASAESGTVIRLPGASNKRPDDSRATATDRETWEKLVAPDASGVLEGLGRIQAADSAFVPAAFVEGARTAYEMIVLAFAKGDRAALTPLLAPDVRDGFFAAITEREAAERTMETTFVSLDKALIADATMRGSTAHVTMRFQPQLITVTRDKDGEVVEGTPDQVTSVVDLWTFARDTTSRDPNWTLVATETMP